MKIHSVKGITLPEVLLVLALAGAIMVFGIRQYASFRSDADVQQLQANIDQLFQAMNAFYTANCGGTLTSGAPQGGLLFIHAINNIKTSPVPPYPLDLQRDIIANGYMTTPLPFSSLIDSSTPGLNYVLQFNESSVPHPNGGVILAWKMQVAILLKDQKLNSAYKNYLNAQCISDMNKPKSGELPTVNVCSTTTPKDATYLVFERTSTNASQKKVSDLSQLTPELMQFKKMYEVSPITNLKSASHSPNEYQYYSCGG
jgi:type II secretory pathway pseudopilin PulG